MLDAQDARESDRDAGFLECLAPGGIEKGLTLFDPARRQVPGLLPLALLDDQEPIAAAHHDEGEAPCRDRGPCHGWTSFGVRRQAAAFLPRDTEKRRQAAALQVIILTASTPAAPGRRWPGRPHVVAEVNSATP